MKFNDAYSQMFPGYPDAVSLQQAADPPHSWGTDPFPPPVCA